MSATFRSTQVWNTAGASHTFTAVAVGSALSTRRVVVGLSGFGTAISLSSLTIGGVAATVHRSQANAAANYLCAIASAIVPTGTTADIAVTFAASVNRFALGVWTFDGAAPSGQSAASADTAAASLSVTTAVGDSVIAADAISGAVGTVTSWTGATERYDELIGNVTFHTGADVDATGTTTAITATATSYASGAAVAVGFTVPVPVVDTRPATNVRVEVAFTTDPDDPTPAFRDLTSRWDIGAGIDIIRGRQDEYGAVTPGRCSLTLDNTDGELTAGRAASSFYPNVKPSRRMRITYRLPTVPGNLLTANQASVETSVTDWSTTSAFGYIGGSTGAQSSTRAVDGTKSLLVTWPTTGVGNKAIYFTSVPTVIGRNYILSVSVWVPTGSNPVAAEVYLLNASAVSTTTDGWQRLSLLFTATNSSHFVGVSTVGSTSGQTVYVDAVMVDEGSTLNAFTTDAPAIEYRFDGYVEEWPTEWPGGNEYTQARVTATDLLARMGTKRILRSVVEETILLSNPVAYYPLGEPEGSTLAGDVTGSNDQVMAIVPVGAAGGTLTFGTGTGPGTDGIPAPMFAPASTTSGFHLEALGIPAVGGYNNVTLRACALTSTAVSQSIAQVVNDWGFYLELRYDATGHLVADYWNPWSGVFEFTITSSSIFSDGLTHNPAVTLSQSAGTITATLYDGGTSLGTASWSAPYLPLFFTMYAGGRRKDRLFTGTLSHIAVFNSALGATALGDQATSTSTGFAGERSDQRIARIASWANLPTARQVLDVGMSTSIAWVDTTGKKPLDAMQQIADTEQGILFADTQGRLVFTSRVDSYSDLPVTASIDAHDVGRDVTPTMSKQGLVNDLVGKRTDGPDQHRTDDASITEHGWYSDSIELAVTTDAEVLSAMQWILVTHAQPVERVPDLAIDAMTNTAIQSQVRALDVGSRLQVTSTPSQSHASTWDLTVQGYQESISESGWQVSVNTTNRAGILGWRVDDAVFSQVDAGYQFVY